MFRYSVYLDCGVLDLTLCSLVVVRSTQKMEALCFNGTLVTTYQSTYYKKPENYKLNFEHLYLTLYLFMN